MSFVKRDGREEYTYKMFGYLLMAVLTIAIIVGLYIIMQHTQTHNVQTNIAENQETLMDNQHLILDNQKSTKVNQELIIQNQNATETNQHLILANQKRLDKLAEDAKAHEEREEIVFGGAIVNNTENIVIHSHVLKNMFDQFTKFYKEYKRDHHRSTGGYYSNDLGVPATSSNNSTQ